MSSCTRLFLIALVIVLAAVASPAQERSGSLPAPSSKPPAVDEWGDDCGHAASVMEQAAHKPAGHL